MTTKTTTTIEHKKKVPARSRLSRLSITVFPPRFSGGSSIHPRHIRLHRNGLTEGKFWGALGTSLHGYRFFHDFMRAWGAPPKTTQYKERLEKTYTYVLGGYALEKDFERVPSWTCPASPFESWCCVSPHGVMPLHPQVLSGRDLGVRENFTFLLLQHGYITIPRWTRCGSRQSRAGYETSSWRSWYHGLVSDRTRLAISAWRYLEVEGKSYV